MKEKISEVEEFFSSIVIPAFDEAKTEMEKFKKNMIVYIRKEDNPTITVIAGSKEYSYTVKVRVSTSQSYPYPQIEIKHRNDYRTYGSEGHFRNTHFDISELTKDEIVRHLLQDIKQNIVLFDKI